MCCEDEAAYFLENTGGHHARMISVVLCAYQRTSDPASAKGLCPAANASWQNLFPHHHFGTTYHAALPSHWDTQTLGLRQPI